ncbi:MAG: MerR family transcriptional regulator [Erysipelotrichales bacterium]|nr:MerR family transcriptional regulator [Erysipelotrichales bacterium]
MKKIHQVCNELGLTKKAIYYYIEKDLIHPCRDEENDYYLFDDETIKQLRLIVMLRKLNIPTNAIEEMLEYPTLLNFFLHRHLDTLRNQINDELHMLDSITNMIDVLPPNATPSNLDNLNINIEPNNILDYNYPSLDARMLTILFFGSFLKQEVDDYRMYLWTKITALFKKEINTSLEYAKHLIYAIPAKALAELTKNQYVLDMKIVQSENIDELENMLVTALHTLLDNKQLQEYWNLEYDAILTPYFEFAAGPAQNFMSEYSVEYKQYLSNIATVNKNVAERLCNGDLVELKEVLMQQLPNHFSNHLHSELHILLSFQNSIFTALPLAQIQEIIQN